MRKGQNPSIESRKPSRQINTRQKPELRAAWPDILVKVRAASPVTKSRDNFFSLLFVYTSLLLYCIVQTLNQFPIKGQERDCFVSTEYSGMLRPGEQPIISHQVDIYIIELAGMDRDG